MKKQGRQETENGRNCIAVGVFEVAFKEIRDKGAR
jgi:hypothetical protein